MTRLSRSGSRRQGVQPLPAGPPVPAPDAPLARSAGDLGQQPGLADARSADDQPRLGPPGGGQVQPVPQPGQLVGTADARRPGVGQRRWDRHRGPADAE